MTTLLICAFIAMLLPYLAKAPVVIEMNRLGGYDNRHPRAQQTQLTGFGARALAAHQNSFEALTVFAVALAVVLGTNTINETTQTLAATHIIARVAYCVCYYLDWHIARSSVWLVGLVSALAMVVVCF